MTSGVVSAETKKSATPSVTFAELVDFPLKAGVGEAEGKLVGAFPARLAALNGQTVEITGYMLPVAMEHGTSREFLLMRNQNSCCYGAAPQPNEYLVVRTSERGVPVVMDQPVAFRGTFKISPVIAQGLILQVFTLEDAAPSRL